VVVVVEVVAVVVASVVEVLVVVVVAMVIVHPDVAGRIAVAREAHRLALVLGSGTRATVDEHDGPLLTGRRPLT
jgi:hypothetical protein